MGFIDFLSRRGIVKEHGHDSSGPQLSRIETLHIESSIYNVFGTTVTLKKQNHYNFEDRTKEENLRDSISLRYLEVITTA